MERRYGYKGMLWLCLDLLAESIKRLIQDNLCKSKIQWGEGKVVDS